MDSFFKSVFSGGGGGEGGSSAAAGAGSQGSPGGAGFGGLVRTLASRSESAIQTCRQDLGEFGVGLLKETAALREALRDLPSSLGAGAAVAIDGSGDPECEQAAGDARAKLVKRVVIASRKEEGDEDRSWEVDDDEEAAKEEQEGRKQRADRLGDEEEATIGRNPVEKKSQELASMADDVSKLDDRRILAEGKAEPIVSCKDSAVSAVSSRPAISKEDDDVGWDDIEDLGDDDDGDDEKKVGVSGGAPPKIDLLRKRLSAAEEDEDLSCWDIEDDDDDEPIKP